MKDPTSSPAPEPAASDDTLRLSRRRLRPRSAPPRPAAGGPAPTQAGADEPGGAQPRGGAGRAASQLWSVAGDALGAVGVSLGGAVLLVVAVWAIAPGVGAGWADAVRLGGWAWLLAHGCPLQAPFGMVTLTPLGLTAVVATVDARAARRTVRRLRAPGTATVGTALFAAVGFALVTAVATAVVGLSATTSAVAFPQPDGVVVAALIAFGAAGVGACAEVCAAVPLPDRVPAAVRGLPRATGAALLALVAGGAVVLAIGLARHAHAVLEVVSTLGTDAGGQIGVLVLDLALLPNAIVCAVAYASGAGFAVGSGAAVGWTGAAYGPLPLVPLLAALPARGVPGPVACATVAAPLAAGVVAGLLTPHTTGCAPAAREVPAAGRTDIGLPVPVPAANGGGAHARRAVAYRLETPRPGIRRAADVVRGAVLRRAVGLPRRLRRLGGAFGARAAAHVRALRPPPGCAGTAARAALAGPGTGVGFALLAVLADGGIGSGRLATLGPSPWLAGLAVAGETAFVAAVTTVVREWHAARRGGQALSRAV